MLQCSPLDPLIIFLLRLSDTLYLSCFLRPPTPSPLMITTPARAHGQRYPPCAPAPRLSPPRPPFPNPITTSALYLVPHSHHLPPPCRCIDSIFDEPSSLRARRSATLLLYKWQIINQFSEDRPLLPSGARRRRVRVRMSPGTKPGSMRAPHMLGIAHLTSPHSAQRAACVESPPLSTAPEPRQ